MNTIQWAEKARSGSCGKSKDSQTSKRIYQEAQNLAHFPDCPNVMADQPSTYGYRMVVVIGCYL